MEKWEANEEIKLFREYLQMATVHPSPKYESCVEFLKQQAQSMQLQLQVFYPGNKENPVVVMTLPGTNPDMPTILLNSHMDVVPVYECSWSHPPFAAEMDSEGKIFARGTQDMKSVGMQYLGALRALKKEGLRFKRTIHISFVPDEEMGGVLGMKPFVQTPEFKSLNIGFALDEGMASPDAVFPVFYGERSVWRIYLNICGASGHGSLLPKYTCGEKLHYILNKMTEMRNEEVKRLEKNKSLTIGDVTTINLTQVCGGIQSNVLPSQLTACFDVRLPLDVDHEHFEYKLKRWCDEAGGGIEIDYEQKQPRVEPTALVDKNVFWMAFRRVFKDMDLQIKPQIFPGGTDSRYIRQLNIPAIGFSPINNTPILLHDNDEYIKADTYLQGIEIYKKLIPKLANVTQCVCAYKE